MNGNGPRKRFVAGGVSVSLWENEINVNGQVKTALKASVQRRYKDKDGQWKSSGSFSRNEIPLAMHCLQKAFEFMIESPGESGDSGDEYIA